jgi:V8-like Glu-specific endopeptidase
MILMGALLLLALAAGCDGTEGTADGDASVAPAEVGSRIATAATFDDTEAYAPGQVLERLDVPAHALAIPAETIERAWIEADAIDAMDPAPGTRIGVAVDLPAIGPANWERIETPAGDVSYRLAIHADGAAHLRAHFAATPAEAIVLVYGTDGEPAREARPTPTAASEDFWSATVAGETLFVEVLGGMESLPRVLVDRLIVGRGPAAETEQGCYLDPTCYGAWTTARNGAAYITFADGGGQYICSGSLLNDVRATGTPWFLTAHHCLSTQASADTTEVVWFFQTSTCNGTVPYFYGLPRTYGSDVMTTNSKSDYTLLKLDAAPPAGVTYLGWTTAAMKKGDAITPIHHPGGAWKRISFGTVSSILGNFWTVKYSQSSTEGGSSGCPLFNASAQVVGQLYGGNAYCTYMRGTDRYGKFSVSYSSGIKNYIGQ